MKSPAAFRASFSDLKIIKTRQCVQLIFELPLAEFDKAYEVLGGLPDSSAERWFGIAAISADERPRQKRTAWADLLPQQQAGIRCDEPIFTAFLKEERKYDWVESADDPAECVRLICGVGSRGELGSNQKARIIWHQLDEQYQAWKAHERA